VSSVRVALYGSGRTATELVTALGRAPHELTAAVVHSPHRAGVDVGQLTIGRPIGLRAATDLEQALESGAVDVLLYAGLIGDRHEHAMEVCARAGVDMIHACFVHPGVALGTTLRARLDASAAASGARIVGTGILPGLWLDVLPALLTSALPEPVTVKARRCSDISVWGRGVLAHELSVGSVKVGMAERYDLVLRESVQLLADVLRLEGADVASHGGLLGAKVETRVGGIDVQVGGVEGFDQRVVAIEDDRERIELSWLGLPDLAARGIHAGLEAVLTATDGSEIVMSLTPPRDPYPGTAARMLGAIRPLRSLPPGLHPTTALAIA
jgi:hypothetical protein